MIKNILILILTLAVVWLSKDYFSITLPNYKAMIPKVSSPYKETKTESKQHILAKKVPILTEKIKSVKKNTHFSAVLLIDLLQQNKFYDALSFYMEHSSIKNQNMIENYLHKLSTINPDISLEYMHVYLDEVPDSKIKNILITTYIHQSQFAKAINLIIESKENYRSQNEDTRLTEQLKITAMQYITTLVNKKEYETLISFLENMIAYDSSNSFYSFRLAQLYIELDKTDEATPLLEDLQYDEVYTKKAKSLIQALKTDEKNDSYEYAIALSKYGSHYVVNVMLDGTTFKLMLDTGASYIYVDEDKASMLEIINPNLHLQTAGGDINAQLCNASSMRIGDMELSNIKVTTAPFKRKGIDGLLGMNFFNKFEFFINQEEGILYLNSK